MASNASTSASWVDLVCPVYCEGPLLSAVQLSGLYNDSKAFVDSPLLFDVATTLTAFSAINASDLQALQTFLDHYFAEPGSDLVPWTPEDWSAQPLAFGAIANASLKSWALQLNELWLTLGRIAVGAPGAPSSGTTDDGAVLVAAIPPGRSSLAPMQTPFFVAGGRFRERYYWDSFFTLIGVVRSGMVASAEIHASGMLNDVAEEGRVANGARAYYADRSQPPLLSEIVLLVADANATQAAAQAAAAMMDPEAARRAAMAEMLRPGGWIEQAVTLLDREYDFWQNESLGHVVNCSAWAPDLATCRLQRHASLSLLPRPEAFPDDLATAEAAGRGNETYSQLRAAAETGWDFSSRWLAGNGSTSGLASIATMDVVPVDLNAILYRMELNLARMHEAVFLASDELPPANASASFRSPTAEAYASAARQRREALFRLLFNNATGAWSDFNMSSGSLQAAASAAMFVPLWAGLADVSPLQEREKMFSAVRDSGLVMAGGIAATLAVTGQQWDMPNSWPPSVYFAVKGLQRLDLSGASTLAAQVAASYVESAYAAYNATGFMYEKYAADEPGQGGGGGEYVPQTGFGWSNGVAIELLLEYYTGPAADDDGRHDDDDGSGGQSDDDDAISVGGLFFSVGMVLSVVGGSVLLTFITGAMRRARSVAHAIASQPSPAVGAIAQPLLATPP